MPKTTIFLASSGGAKSQAKALVNEFTTDTLEFLPWWNAFTPGKTLLGELDGIKNRVDGALILLSPEAPATMRGNSVAIPNQNVLFEFGFFYGALGAQKVGVIKYGDYYLPSGLGGYIHISGSKFSQPKRIAQVGKKTKADFAKWIAQL